MIKRVWRNFYEITNWGKSITLTREELNEVINELKEIDPTLVPNSLDYEE